MYKGCLINKLSARTAQHDDRAIWRYAPYLLRQASHSLTKWDERYITHDSAVHTARVFIKQPSHFQYHYEITYFLNMHKM
jgi:hypothetical protein